MANGTITITTNHNRWGRLVGEVTTAAIKFPVSLGIDPINDLLADAFGSDVSVGVLTADWRISLGGKVVAVSTDKGLKNTNSPIDQLLDGVPYLRQKGPINITANLGPISISYPVIEKPVDWAFDPADPMLYLRARSWVRPSSRRWPSRCTVCWNTSRWISRRRRSKRASRSSTATFWTATIPFKIRPIPFEADAEISLASMPTATAGRSATCGCR